MIKTLATLAILAASACSAYTNTVLVSTNTRAATEKWVSLRFEATLPSTPTNPASKYLNGNREWSSISLGHPQLSDINGDVDYQHITTGQVAKLDYISDNGVLRVRDTAQPSRYFLEVVNGTGTVFEVTGHFTNLMVTLSEDFKETVTHTRPAWTNNVFPFVESQWVGGFVENAEGNADYYYIESSAGTTVTWAETTETLPASLTLLSGYGSGTATVSVASIYYTTNVFAHFATESEFEAAKAACGVVLTNTVNAATNALMPYARTLYGDLATTNEAGYAAFNATSAAAASYSAIVPTSFIGSNTNTLRYRFNSLRKFGAVTNTAWFLKSGFGAGIKSVSTLVSVKDASGNVISQSSSQPVYLSDSGSPSSITNVFTMPDNVYSGTVDVACIAVSTNASFAVRLYSGAQYTNLLTFSESPMAYATHAELRSLRAEIPAIVMSNSVPQTIVRSVSVSSTNILVSSTHSVYYVALTNAANVGFDFSALSLGGTKRADITAVIDCLNTQALYSAINTNLVAMDCPWEPTVTGRYELAVSSDGVRTTLRQTWPQVAVWRTLKYAYAPGGGWVDSLQRFHVDNSYTNSLIVEPGIISPLIFVRFEAFLNVNKPIYFEYGYASVINPGTDKPSVVYGPFGPDGGEFMDVARPVEFGAETTAGRLLQVWIGNQSPEPIATVMFYPSRSRARAANALERAAYNAGAYPAAFRLDY